MKRVLIIITALLCTLFTVMMGQTSYAEKKVVAIPRVQSTYGGGEAERACQDFETQMIGVLIKSGQYQVVERSRLTEVLDELGIQDTGLISGDTAIQFGEMTGAQYTLTSRLLDARIDVVDKYLFKAKVAKVKFDIRLIDNKTGIIMTSETIEGSKTAPMDVPFVGTAGISEAVNDATKNLIKYLDEKYPLSGNVAHVTDSQVYLDLGSENGVRVGEKFIVYREGAPIINPMTHELMAVEENKVGLVKIVEVKPNYAVAEYANGKGQIKVSDKVKRGHK